MSRRGGVLEFALPGRGQNDLTGGKEVFKVYKLTIKWTLSKTVFKDFPNTLRAPPNDCFWESIYCITQKNWYFWICLQNLFWRISHFLKMQGNEACNFSKNAALTQVFFCYTLRTVTKNFRSFSRFFQFISTSHSVPFKLMRAFNRYTNWKMQIFEPVAHGNAADTASHKNSCFSQLLYNFSVFVIMICNFKYILKDVALVFVLLVLQICCHSI